jgi:uncharacterized cupredoxin-like copper-binding protein
LRVVTLVAIAALAAVPATANAPAPSRIFVSAKEWSLILSRQTLRAGEARIQLHNAGEDAHDLRLRRVGGTRSLGLAETSPGKVAEIRAVLRPGRWRLWCSLPGHEAKGMRATLTVQPR